MLVPRQRPATPDLKVSLGRDVPSMRILPKVGDQYEPRDNFAMERYPCRKHERMRVEIAHVLEGGRRGVADRLGGNKWVLTAGRGQFLHYPFVSGYTRDFRNAGVPEDADVAEVHKLARIVVGDFSLVRSGDPSKAPIGR